jgi:hypothetical protein
VSFYFYYQHKGVDQMIDKGSINFGGLYLSVDDEEPAIRQK